MEAKSILSFNTTVSFNNSGDMENIRNSLEAELNLSFKTLVSFNNSGDKEMFAFSKQNFRAKIELANSIGLLTLNEWSFLNRACALI